MKNIKMFEEFSFEDQLDTDLKDNTLVSAIDRACEKLDVEYLSYSTASEVTRRGRMNRGSGNNPKEDLSELLKELSSEGWTVEKIKLALKNKKVFDAISDRNAVVDLFLYHFSDGKFPLSGMSAKELDENVGWGDSILKYCYGYHKSQYGLLFLYQNFKTPEKTYEYLATQIIPYLLSDELACSEVSKTVIDGVIHEEDFKPSIFKSCYTLNTQTRNMIIDLKKLYKILDSRDWFKYSTSYDSFVYSVRNDDSLKNLKIGIQDDKLALEFDPIDFNKIEKLNA